MGSTPSNANSARFMYGENPCPRNSRKTRKEDYENWTIQINLTSKKHVTAIGFYLRVAESFLKNTTKNWCERSMKKSFMTLRLKLDI